MYAERVLNGRLHDYLTINDQAEQRMEGLIQQMKGAQGVTEQLKAAPPMEWTDEQHQGVRQGDRGTGEHLRVNEKAVKRESISVRSFLLMSFLIGYKIFD